MCVQPFCLNRKKEAGNRNAGVTVYSQNVPKPKRTQVKTYPSEVKTYPSEVKTYPSGVKTYPL